MEWWAMMTLILEVAISLITCEMSVNALSVSSLCLSERQRKDGERQRIRKSQKMLHLLRILLPAREIKHLIRILNEHRPLRLDLHNIRVRI